VFLFEPATKENEPLLSLPNLLFSPHLGYVEKGSYELFFKISFEKIMAFTHD
jgi:D-3-phosphoglycerate dehydrogenase